MGSISVNAKVYKTKHTNGAPAAYLSDRETAIHSPAQLAAHGYSDLLVDPVLFWDLEFHCGHDLKAVHFEGSQLVFEANPHGMTGEVMLAGSVVLHPDITSVVLYKTSDWNGFPGCRFL
jgi:hypothetical protein